MKRWIHAATDLVEEAIINVCDTICRDLEDDIANGDMDFEECVETAVTRLTESGTPFDIEHVRDIMEDFYDETLDRVADKW